MSNNLCKSSYNNWIYANAYNYVVEFVLGFLEELYESLIMVNHLGGILTYHYV